MKLIVQSRIFQFSTNIFMLASFEVPNVQCPIGGGWMIIPRVIFDLIWQTYMKVELQLVLWELVLSKSPFCLSSFPGNIHQLPKHCLAIAVPGK